MKYKKSENIRDLVRGECLGLNNNKVIWNEILKILSDKYSIEVNTIRTYLGGMDLIKNLKCIECHEIFQNKDSKKRLCPKCDTIERKKAVKRLCYKRVGYKKNKLLKSDRALVARRYGKYPRNCYNPVKYLLFT